MENREGTADARSNGADAWLVARAQSGDRAAFAGLVERYQQPLNGYLLRLTGDREVALDLLQETFIRAYLSIHKTTAALLVRPWLYRIATNLARDSLRRKRRFTWLPLSLVDQFFHSDETEVTEERELVQRALGRLRPDERAVLLLCGLEQLAYDQAAAVLGGSTDAVRKRFARAKARFRLVYGEIAGATAGTPRAGELAR